MKKKNVKPSLFEFLTTFRLKGVKEKGDGWQNISKGTYARREIIKQNNIPDEVLEMLWQELQKRGYGPFSNLAFLVLEEDPKGIWQYKINVPADQLVDTFIDILKAFIQGHKELEEKGEESIRSESEDDEVTVGDIVRKPSLHQFLVDFKMDDVVQTGTGYQNLSVNATNRRKYLRDNKIPDIVLEKMWNDYKDRRHPPYSSFAFLKLREKPGEYYIDVPANKMIEIYLDMLKAVIEGHKIISRKKKREAETPPK
jgi:hypothetical protein